MKKKGFEKISEICGVAYISDGTGNGENYKYVVYIHDQYQEELLGEIWGAGDSIEKALKEAFKNLCEVALKSIPVGKRELNGWEFSQFLEHFQEEKGFLGSPPNKIMPSFEYMGDESQILGVSLDGDNAIGALY